MVQKQTLQLKVGYVQVPQNMGNFFTVSDCPLLKKEYLKPLVMTEISG
jgi:hypothetical protein